MLQGPCQLIQLGGGGLKINKSRWLQLPEVVQKAAHCRFF
jgi:hypothetical protein